MRGRVGEGRVAKKYNWGEVDTCNASGQLRLTSGDNRSGILLFSLLMCHVVGDGQFDELQVQPNYHLLFSHHHYLVGTFEVLCYDTHSCINPFSSCSLRKPLKFIKLSIPLDRICGKGCDG